MSFTFPLALFTLLQVTYKKYNFTVSQYSRLACKQKSPNFAFQFQNVNPSQYKADASAVLWRRSQSFFLDVAMKPSVRSCTICEDCLISLLLCVFIKTAREWDITFLSFCYKKQFAVKLKPSLHNIFYRKNNKPALLWKSEFCLHSALSRTVLHKVFTKATHPQSLKVNL